MQTVDALLGLGDFSRAALVLQHAGRYVKQRSEWSLLETAWNRVGTAWLENPLFTAARLNVLRGVRDADRLLELMPLVLENFPNDPEVLIEIAWALTVEAKTELAVSMLETILERSIGAREQGLAHRFLALLVQEPLVHYEQCFDLLTARELGLAKLQQADWCLNQGRYEAARESLFDARALLRSDSFYLAWIEYNLGISYLRNADPQGESHFLAVERLARRGDAKSFQSRAWFGLGGVRRLRGELERALDSYQRAARSATEPDDRTVAHWGIAHCLRLLGRTAEALSRLHSILEAGESPDWLWVDLAATQLELGDTVSAQNSLDRSGVLYDHNAHRAAIVKAELARRINDLNLTIKYLQTVPRTGLVAQEESLRFAWLFALWDAHTGFVAPRQAPLAQYTVTVKTQPVLQVWVNGRDIGLTPNGKPAELLAFLITQDGAASIYQISEALYGHPKALKKRNAQQSISDLIRKVRAALGWQASIQSTRGAYVLDSKMTWNLESGSGRFLTGIDSNWVVERDQKLN